MWRDIFVALLRERLHQIVVGSPEKTAGLKWGDFGLPTIISGDIEQQIRALKQKSGGDIITFGSPTLVESLTSAGLVDEFYFLVYPVIVDYGKHLFENPATRTDLSLKAAKSFPHGATTMHYAVAKH